MRLDKAFARWSFLALAMAFILRGAQQLSRGQATPAHRRRNQKFLCGATPPHQQFVLAVVIVQTREPVCARRANQRTVLLIVLPSPSKEDNPALMRVQGASRDREVIFNGHRPA